MNSLKVDGFHVRMNIRQHLTMMPRTDAGRRLLGLDKALSDVHEVADAVEWQKRLDAWWRVHGLLTKERAYVRNGQVRFTHERPRKGRLLLRKLARSGTLFTEPRPSRPWG